MRRFAAFDMPLLICIICMVGLGIAFIYSASYPRALVSPEANGNSFYFAQKQLIFLIPGLGILLGTMFIPLATLRRLYGVIIFGAISMLLLVLVFGRDTFGNVAYLKFGPVQIQPSEFAKVAIIITLATFLSRRPWTVKSWKGLFTGPFLFLLVPVALVGAGKDFGTVFVIGLATSAFLLVAGTRLRFIAIPFLVIAGMVGLMTISGHLPDRIESRIRAWLNPEDLSNPASYHPRNGLIAVGSGGLLGRGFNQSGQKWFYLPAPHNDYIFAVICEELGFVGTFLLLFAPYLFLVYRGFTIAHRAPDEFSALLAAGSTVMLGTQTIVNMAVVLNLIPSMGINMPFISYGGSSIIASLILAGLLLNVSAQSSATDAQGARTTPETQTGEATFSPSTQKQMNYGMISGR